MKKISLNWWQIACGFAMIFLAGYFISNISLNTKPKDQKDGSKELHQSGYKYISPLLECSDIHDIKQYHLEEQMKDIIQNNIQNNNITYASLYFRDLNNGPWIGINEQEKFTPASLLKVPLMIAYLKMAESDAKILDNEIKIEEAANNLSQNIVPLDKVEIGKSYKVSELIRYMIMYSDNNAANALLLHINAEYLNQTYSDLGIIAPDGATQTENFMNVKDYASFFRILYNASYLNRDMSEKALEILTASQFNQGLKAGLPENVKLAHKFGERIFLENKQLHDCGIIYKEKSPYLLCIMTRGNDFNKMSAAIKELSAEVYKEFK